jgi:MFS family permease
VPLPFRLPRFLGPRGPSDSGRSRLGGLLLLAARAGDLVGHRRVFRVGLAVFTLASLAGGLATSGPLLLAARAVQGIGAAALAPSSLSLITTTHTEAGRRTKALALWSLMGGAAGAAGVVLGGVLTAEVSWRLVLFVNVPVGVVLLAAAGLVLPRAPRRTGGGLDLPGALLVTAAAIGLTFGLSRAPSDGWTSAQVLGPLVAAPVLLALFALAEARSATPLVPPSLLRSRSLGAGVGLGAADLRAPDRRRARPGRAHLDRGLRGPLVRGRRPGRRRRSRLPRRVPVQCGHHGARHARRPGPAAHATPRLTAGHAVHRPGYCS